MEMEPSPCEEKQTSTQEGYFTYTLDHHLSKTLNEKPRANDVVSIKEEDNVQSSQQCSTHNVDAKYTWKDVSSALDVIFFWVFLASNCLITMIFFSLMMQ
jgi:hypothetical protein